MTLRLRPEHLSTLRWRSIGPHRGGRVVAAASDPEERQTFYFGACAGGVGKTTDGDYPIAIQGAPLGPGR